MKKLLVLCLCLGLVFGCAGFGKWSTGAQKIVDLVCSPSDAQKAEAAKWLAAIDGIQTNVAVFFPAVSIMKASAAMTTLKNGGCFLLSEIEAALALLESMQNKQAAVLALRKAPMTSAEQFPILYALVKKGK